MYRVKQIAPTKTLTFHPSNTTTTTTITDKLEEDIDESCQYEKLTNDEVEMILSYLPLHNPVGLVMKIDTYFGKRNGYLVCMKPNVHLTTHATEWLQWIPLLAHCRNVVVEFGEFESVLQVISYPEYKNLESLEFRLVHCKLDLDSKLLISLREALELNRNVAKVIRALDLAVYQRDSAGDLLTMIGMLNGLRELSITDELSNVIFNSPEYIDHPSLNTIIFKNAGNSAYRSNPRIKHIVFEDTVNIFTGQIDNECKSVTIGYRHARTSPPSYYSFALLSEAFPVVSNILKFPNIQSLKIIVPRQLAYKAYLLFQCMQDVQFPELTRFELLMSSIDRSLASNLAVVLLCPKLNTIKIAKVQIHNRSFFENLFQFSESQPTTCRSLILEDCYIQDLVLEYIKQNNINWRISMLRTNHYEFPNQTYPQAI